MALVGAQQLLGVVADAPATDAANDSHNLLPLPEVQQPVDSARVDASVSTGQFEEFVEPAPALVPTVAPTPVPPTPAPTATPPPILFESGIASTYGEGDGFEGNLTACGQVFHTNVVQIAHKSLPCGTRVRVEATSNGRSIEASVTDRGPYVPGRIVDLSWAAFSQLDPTGPGLLHVNLYILGT